MVKKRQNVQETILSRPLRRQNRGRVAQGQKFRSLCRKPYFLYLSTKITVLQRVMREKTGDSAAGLW